MNYKKLHIFTGTSWPTYTFKNVEILTDNETVLVFRYQAMSDGEWKIATFIKSLFVGYSVLPWAEEKSGYAASPEDKNLSCHGTFLEGGRRRQWGEPGEPQRK